MKPANIFLVVCIAAGIVFLSGLGVWQLNRLAWKETLIERVKQNLNNPPLSVEQIDALRQGGKDFEYRPVTVSGVFDHTGEQHFFATHKSKPGYFVYTPLKRDNGQIVFVNRGYIPLEKKVQKGREGGLVQGRVNVTGLARSAPLEKPNSFVPNNDLVKNIYYWKSISQMFGRAYDKMEIDPVLFFIDADDQPSPGDLPQGGVTLMEFPNSHLQYALTWFGLAGALFFVGGFFLFGRIRKA